jgi:glycosyltransferase involved in cell wall biosynthesis/SAM-dependent methyltransferase
MRILLSYSRPHFDPNPGAEQEFGGSSTHTLARALYELLSEHGEVTYIDSSEYAEVSGGTYDLFVGQIRNFHKIVASCSIGKSVLFAVNMHPVVRNGLLLRAVQAAKLPTDALATWDLVDEAEGSKSIEAADCILAVGTVALYNSYIEQGVRKNKIKVLNYGLGPSAATVAKRPSPPRFLYAASEIGLRKGFELVADMAERLLAGGADFRLDIVGSPTTAYYRSKLEKLTREYPVAITFHGWLDADSERYLDIYRRNSFLLGPALEEGQTGVVVDAMRFGVIPIVSRNAGVDFSPLGMFDMEHDSPDNLKIFEKALHLSDADVQALAEKTVEHYREYHENFYPAFREALSGCISGELYPKMSITLPIFNKEHTIVPLLEHLDRAAAAYGNVELHVIFDGCKDRTEQKVRSFFEVARGYPVTFEVTPDIFEVKTNNIGLRKSTGKYCVIMQDDNYIYDENLLFEAAIFLDKNPRAAVLGTLAGVNFYPIGTKLSGAGHISTTGNEAYWRQDADTDPELADKFFQVDACMRGPLIVRNSFVQEHGYLDEVYAPMYMDDMDLGFRAAHHGFKVYGMLGAVENASLTMAHYDLEESNRFGEVLRRNTQTFYERWSPGTDKDYARCERVRISGASAKVTRFQANTATRLVVRKRLTALRRTAVTVLQTRRIFDSNYCEELSGARRRQQLNWLTTQAAKLPDRATVVGIGAGARYFRGAFAHTDFTLAHDSEATAGPEGGGLDAPLAFPREYADAVVCLDAFPDGLTALDVLAESSRILKPGGRLIFSASRSGDRWGDSKTGLTRAWYENSFRQHGLRIITLQPNAGLFAHVIELLWHGRDTVITAFSGGNVVKKVIARALQVGLFNLPTLGLTLLEDRWLLEDFTAAYLCVAEKPAPSPT